MQKIAPYATAGQPIPLEHAMIQHKWADFFGGVMAYRQNQQDETSRSRTLQTLPNTLGLSA